MGFLHNSLGFSLLFFSQHQKSSSTFHVSLGRTRHRYHRARPAGEQLCCEGQRHEPAATGRPGGAHQCPIYLEDVEDSAYVPFCLHGSRSAGIQPWARQSAMCRLCRQPFHLLLCLVPADGHYKEYTVPSYNHCHSTRPRGEAERPAGCEAALAEHNGRALRPA